MPWIKRPDRKQECKRYDATRHSNPVLSSVARFRSSWRWRKTSIAFLSHSPLCCDPFGNHKSVSSFSPAMAVHHKIPLAENLELGLDWDNLAAVCITCHNKLEAQERLGKRFSWVNVDQAKHQPIS